MRIDWFNLSSSRAIILGFVWDVLLRIWLLVFMDRIKLVRRDTGFTGRKYGTLSNEKIIKYDQG